MRASGKSHSRDDYAPNTTTPSDLVLGCILGDNALAGRSPEHTARVLREHSGSTPTEFVNRLRIEHAARLLCTTEKNILETALDCGFENQGYFHRSFKARFGGLLRPPVGKNITP